MISADLIAQDTRFLRMQLDLTKISDLSLLVRLAQIEAKIAPEKGIASANAIKTPIFRLQALGSIAKLFAEIYPQKSHDLLLSFDSRYRLCCKTIEPIWVEICKHVQKKNPHTALDLSWKIRKDSLRREVQIPCYAQLASIDTPKAIQGLRELSKSLDVRNQALHELALLHAKLRNYEEAFKIASEVEFLEESKGEKQHQLLLQLITTIARTDPQEALKRGVLVEDEPAQGKILYKVLKIALTTSLIRKRGEKLCFTQWHSPSLSKKCGMDLEKAWAKTLIKEIRNPIWKCYAELKLRSHCEKAPPTPPSIEWQWLHLPCRYVKVVAKDHPEGALKATINIKDSKCYAVAIGKIAMSLLDTNPSKAFSLVKDEQVIMAMIKKLAKKSPLEAQGMIPTLPPELRVPALVEILWIKSKILPLPEWQ